MSVRQLSALLGRPVAICTPDGPVQGTVLDVSMSYGRSRAVVLVPDYRPEASGGDHRLTERPVSVDVARLIVPVGEGRYTPAADFLATVSETSE